MKDRDRLSFHSVTQPYRLRTFQTIRKNGDESIIKEFKETDRNKGFDLQKGPLMRLTLFKREKTAIHAFGLTITL